MTVKKKLILEGLDCASCSAKIEGEINKFDGVNANINFATKTLFLEYADDDFDIDNIGKVIKKHEPHVEIIDEEMKKASHNIKGGIFQENKLQILRLISSGILLALGLLLNLDIQYTLMLFLASYLIVGADIVLRAVRNLISGSVFDENFLMSIATIGAFLIGEYAEAVGVMLFYQTGELFQDIAVNSSRKSISELLNIKAEYANLKTEDGIIQVNPEEIQIDDIILIKPGEKVPLDGQVIDGYSTVDTSALTGESIPRDMETSDEILSGFINLNGVLTVKVKKRFEDSTVSRILELVENASSRKAPTENFITKFARYYTPIVVLAALFIAVVPPLILQGSFNDWIYRALIFLVISCPCALVVSIPLGFFGGIGAASKHGILIKGANYLEALNDLDTVVFDKTGTLTKGVFKVTDIISKGKYSKEEILEFGAYAESMSNHPIANSIKSEYGEHIDESKINEYEEIAGKGIKVKFEDKIILAGNKKLMNDNNIIHENLETMGTLVYIAVDKTYQGHIVISDELKDDSISAIKSLKEKGIEKLIMLTGDTRKVGELVGNQLGLDQVYAELLPQDKVSKMEEIENNGNTNKKIAYVGDGINDAPVLAGSDIGIAMGGLGSDAAIEAADIVIMTDEISKISTSLNIARKTKRIVYQNIVFALGVKAIFLIMGAFGIATMWEAVFADVGVTIIAVLNSVRILRYKE